MWTPDIPTIDLSGTGTGTGRGAGSPARREVAAAIGRANEDIGFFVVANHGVDPDLVASVLATSREFFEQPPAVKRLACDDPPNRYRGFSAPEDRNGESGAFSDLVESFEAGRWENPEAMIAGGYAPEKVASYRPNVWPGQPREFRATWAEYFEAMSALAEHLMSLMATALGLDADWFVPRFDRHCSYLTANYYPPQPVAPPPGQWRQSAHTDFGSLTILYQDSDIGGLQVRRRDGRWIDVPAVPGTFIVNLGDLLAKWTNDRWVATEHRVVNPPRERAGTARVSIPFFQHPNLDALIEAIPTCVPAGEVSRYPAVAAGDWAAFRMNRYSGAYSS